MKKTYQEIELDVIRFECEDIITSQTGEGEEEG